MTCQPPSGRCFTKRLFPDIWASELSGILNRALEGYRRLDARGGFQSPSDCVAAKQKFLAAANPLVTFIDEECDTLKSQQNAIRGQHELDVNNLKVRTPEVMKHMEGVLDTKLRELKVRQAITEFYYQFREWCQQEGSRWVPQKERGGA